MSRPLSPLVPRLEAQIDFYGPGGCWMWTGGANNMGYGVVAVKVRGKWTTKLAHRVVYELLVGPIPEGEDLDHVCHNRDKSCSGGRTCPHRRCVNPGCDHAEPASRSTNLRRGDTSRNNGNKLKMHCKHGHEFTPENTARRSGRVGRYCRTCNRAATARHRAKTRGR